MKYLTEHEKVTELKQVFGRCFKNKNSINPNELIQETLCILYNFDEKCKNGGAHEWIIDKKGTYCKKCLYIKPYFVK